MVMVTQESKP